MPVSIDDIAMQCGVDADTVQRVLDSARARGSRSLGILYADESGRGLTHSFFSPILNAVKEEAAGHGYDVTFIRPQADYLERCLGVDGVCMVCVDFAAPQIRALVTSGIPCVTVDHIFKGAPAVLSDNETGVRKLVEYALSQGHRRIAFIHGHNNSVVTRARIQQFQNTMAYYKLPVPEGYLREGRYDNVPLTRQLVAELLKLDERPTCILLPDDITYLGAMEAARDFGLDIPGDISFAGYDGIALIQKLDPPLTTIRQDAERMGHTAARLLIDQIENPATAKRKPFIFPVEFMPGGTMTPPH